MTQCQYHEQHEQRRGPIDWTGQPPCSASPTCTRSDEDSFRRGYWYGYSQAMDDYRQMGKRGFLRHSEIWNVLAKFYDDILTKWRYGNLSEQDEPPRFKAPDSWNTIRQRVIERDKGCVVCESTHRLEVDHIQPVKEGGLPDDDNLRTLCARCHAERRRK